MKDSEVLIQVVKPIEGFPIPRWGLSLCLLNDEILLFGGEADSCTETDGIEPLFRINPTSYEFTCQYLPNGPRSRDSHSCVVIQDKMFVWGGCKRKYPCNDCFYYGDRQWKSVNQRGRIPSQREGQLSVAIQNRWLMLYGGCRNKKILNDFHLFDAETFTWFDLDKFSKESCEPPERENGTLVSIQNQIYMFGGQDQQQKYSNDMYKISLEHFNLEKRGKAPLITMELLKCQGKPAPRSAHTALVYKNTYILILCGQTFGKTAEESTVLRDMWSFCTVTLTWTEIIVNQPDLMKPRSYFSAVLYNDDIYIFGGMTGEDKPNIHDSLVILELDSKKKLLNRNMFANCSQCGVLFKEKQREKIEDLQVRLPMEQVRIQIHHVVNAVNTIQHPFYAIKLIIQHFMLRKGFNINIQTDVVNGRLLMRFVSYNSLPYEPEKSIGIFKKLSLTVEDYYREDMLPFVIAACYRLSNQFLIVNNFKGLEVTVGMYSQQSIHWRYINRLTGLTKEGDPKAVDKYNDIIAHVPEKFLNEGTFQIVLVEPLKGFQLLDGNIEYTDEFLKSLSFGYKVKPWQANLKSYLSRLFLGSPEELTLCLNGQVVKFSKPNTDGKNIPIQEMPYCHIYFSPTTTNNSVAIYHNNILVDFLHGHRWKQYNGFINLPTETSINLFRCNLEQTRHRKIIESSLEKILNSQFSRQHLEASIQQIVSDSVSILHQ